MLDPLVVKDDDDELADSNEVEEIKYTQYSHGKMKLTTKAVYIPANPDERLTKG